MAAKKIENKDTSIDIQDGSQLRKTNYFDLIKMCLNQMPQGGFTREEIKKRNRIEKKLVGQIAELEHDEFHHLKKVCNEMRWSNKHEDIETFYEYIEDVK